MGTAERLKRVEDAVGRLWSPTSLMGWPSTTADKENVMAGELEDMTFEELVDEAARSIHSRLLEGGSKEMKSAIYLWMSTAIRWHGSTTAKPPKKKS